MDIKLKASTLLETMIAMVIVTVVISFAAIIYLNVFKGSENGRKMYAQSTLEGVREDIISGQRFIDDERQLNGFHIIIRCKLRNDSKNAVDLKIKATDENNITNASITEVILIK